MRAYLALIALPFIVSCGGSSSTAGGATKPIGNQATGQETRGFDEYPTEYGADEYGDFYGEGYGYDGYDGGYDDGEGYGGEYTPPAPQPPALAGSWTGGCAVAGKGSQKLAAVFTDARWDLTVEIFGDAACATRTTLRHLGGPYTIGEASTTVAGAWNGVFSFDVRELTADDAKTAKALGKACAIKKMKAGTAVDLLAKGCAGLGWKPVEECAADYDVVALDGDRVRFGVRPADNDLCTEARRPTALDVAYDLGWVWPTIGIPECDALITTLSTWSRCSIIPADQRGQALPQIQAMVGSYTDADTCKMTNDAMQQAMADMGC